MQNTVTIDVPAHVLEAAEKLIALDAQLHSTGFEWSEEWDEAHKTAALAVARNIAWMLQK